MYFLQSRNKLLGFAGSSFLISTLFYFLSENSLVMSLRKLLYFFVRVYNRNITNNIIISIKIKHT